MQGSKEPGAVGFGKDLAGSDSPFVLMHTALSRCRESSPFRCSTHTPRLSRRSGCPTVSILTSKKLKSKPEALNQDTAWNPDSHSRPLYCALGLSTNSSQLFGRSLLNDQNSYQLSQELHWAILSWSVQNMKQTFASCKLPVLFNTILHCHSLGMIFQNDFQLSEADNMLAGPSAIPHYWSASSIMAR